MVKDAIRPYRKKPVEIEAVQLTETNRGSLLRWMGDSGDVPFRGGSILITTLEGIMEASVGDYIIKGVQGEFYPCKPDIFEASYEVIL